MRIMFLILFLSLSFSSLAKNEKNYVQLKDTFLKLSYKKELLLFELNSLDNNALRKKEIENEISKNIDPQLKKIQSQVEKIELTEKVYAWNRVLSKFTKTNSVYKKAFEQNLGYVNLDCKHYFFNSDSDFNNWIKFKSDFENEKNIRIEYGASKSKAIRKCIEKKGNFVKRVSVNRTDKFVCEGAKKDDPKSLQTLPVNYDVYIKNNQVNVDMRIKLKYRGDKEKFNDVKNRLGNALGCIERVYANQGIKFNLLYSFDLKSSDNYHITVNAYDKYPLSDAFNWGVISDQNTTNTSSYLCMLLSHEIGHLFGLWDGYFDARCANRVVGKYNEIMTSTGNAPMTAKFNEDQIESIIQPLCEN